MEISQRLEKIIRDLGQSPASFADEIRVQRSGISHILSGRNKPSLEFLEKLHQRFPEVDLVWLITGSRQIPSSHSEISIENQPQEVNTSKNIEENKVRTKGEAFKKSIIALYSDGTFEEFLPKS